MEVKALEDLKAEHGALARGAFRKTSVIWFRPRGYESFLVRDRERGSLVEVKSQ